MKSQPIENYGIIGNLETVALVGLNGSIDFFCFPEFDSPTVFASLLDHAEGGFFRVEPELGDARQTQLYLPETNVLLTRFLADTGVAEISDFMPVGDQVHRNALIRRIATVRGTVKFHITCAPRFDYGRAKHVVRRQKDGLLFIPTGEDATAMRLRCEEKLSVEQGAAHLTIELHAGESVHFVLEEADASCEGDPPLAEWCDSSFHSTVRYWRQWSARSSYQGRWREMVQRSALTLKLLTSRKHGSLVAAPTMALPEAIGGARNWDYRYTWIRDSAFTVYALLRLGYTDEARGFMDWVEHRCEEINPDGSLQIMYGIDGRHRLEESILPHLEGYRGSSPVRLGNAAYDQLQLDIYGELIDSVYLHDKYGAPVSFDFWDNIVRLVDWVCKNWRRKDEGIWEVRGGKQEFLYSRLMCWVAIDRALRLAEKRSLPAPIVRWRQTRDKIHNEILGKFWSAKRQSFVQYKGAETVDASCLLMPLVRFISPSDPRWLSTLDAVTNDLVDDSLVYRYRTDEAASDGLAGEEGTFNICSFWYVECLSLSGQLDKAQLLFEKMLGYANHLGLYSEELGPAGEHLGNFPQAFTHLSLISAAFALNRNLDGGWRA
ncbi:MAG: glycoside hydrolase family 15 protein [bacterium]